MPRGKLVAIAENRSERIRNAPPCGLAADKVRDVRALQPGMQPLGPAHVCVRVREERLVSKIDRIWQRCAPQNPVWATGSDYPLSDLVATYGNGSEITKPARSFFWYIPAVSVRIVDHWTEMY